MAATSSRVIAIERARQAAVVDLADVLAVGPHEQVVLDGAGDVLPRAEPVVAVDVVEEHVEVVELDVVGDEVADDLGALGGQLGTDVDEDERPRAASGRRVPRAA